jgi:hypothetical protein
MPATASKTTTQSSTPWDSDELRDHLIERLGSVPLEREPFCHIYIESIFPPELYQQVLLNLPPKELYFPLNLRKWVRPDGTSTRDQFYVTPEYLAKLPPAMASLWGTIAQAMSDEALKRAVFAKLAPDLADRFSVSEDQVPDIECVRDVLLVRDTEDYLIKPHPDGLNKIVTMQFYLPPDDSQLDLGTSLFTRQRGLLGAKFEEVKRFPFKPNSAYAFAVSDSDKRTSWHGREKLTGFTGVRNTMMVLFQQVSTARPVQKAPRWRLGLSR